MAARLYIAGTGSYAAEIASWASAAGATPAGLIELRDESRVGSRIHDLPVASADDPPPDAVAVIGVGGSRLEAWRPLAEAGWTPAPAIVHPSASVAESAALQGGVTIGPIAVVGAHSTVAAHALVSRGALLGHHVRVGEFATVGPGANVGGNTEVGRAAFLGIGSVVSNGLGIGAGALVAAGAVALRDVPGETRVQGVPARPYP